ncbi:16S rRNA (guanine(527)-N(7))-methyltransferase RsmG [Paracoccus albus]|uniref:16S rRNA (guanine(527)-N(7))-methyltransferase RsmG n=1 Tax=Paracoccus albus TaxID=3017784 RepID=UPI0022F0D578|nr:16S rRNA (guanine(527)-N(7))-methyltransferase RsmG [Paracoccus albus]WBU60027.1 16S rRNA (guanine(527)-N(7))-methyltransferase RsmG [Paracoccus albus]
MNVSRETTELFQVYADLIRKWNPTINLVAPATISDLYNRHIADSAQIFQLSRPKMGTWLDLGSGGGLPGIVLAILARNIPLAIILAESDKRKAAFLSTVKRELGLNKLSVKNTRIETLDPGKYDFVSARALAALDKLMPTLHRQLALDGEAWLMKGRSWKAEVEAARKGWSFELDSFQSATDPEAAVLKLRNIEPND